MGVSGLIVNLLLNKGVNVESWVAYTNAVYYNRFIKNQDCINLL